jgi:hypothetical protein
MLKIFAAFAPSRDYLICGEGICDIDTLHYKCVEMRFAAIS